MCARSYGWQMYMKLARESLHLESRRSLTKARRSSRTPTPRNPPPAPDPAGRRHEPLLLAVLPRCRPRSPPRGPSKNRRRTESPVVRATR